MSKLAQLQGFTCLRCGGGLPIRFHPVLPTPAPRRGSPQLGRREERQRPGSPASRRLSARRGPQAPGTRPPRRRDAQEEGQLRRGGGEGGAQEEMREGVR